MDTREGRVQTLRAWEATLTAGQKQFVSDLLRANGWMPEKRPPDDLWMKALYLAEVRASPFGAQSAH
jgi:hypothetical protein